MHQCLIEVEHQAVGTFFNLSRRKERRLNVAVERQKLEVLSACRPLLVADLNVLAVRRLLLGRACALLASAPLDLELFGEAR